jgi:hypothetical protein
MMPSIPYFVITMFADILNSPFRPIFNSGFTTTRDAHRTLSLSATSYRKDDQYRNRTDLHGREIDYETSRRGAVRSSRNGVSHRLMRSCTVTFITLFYQENGRNNRALSPGHRTPAEPCDMSAAFVKTMDGRNN